MEPMLGVAGVLGLSVVLAVAVYVTGRIRVERERTLQKLVDRGLTAEELVRIAGSADPARVDRRRAALLLAVGASWTAVTFTMGGRAWVLGIVPVALGVALLVFRMLDARGR